MHSMFTDNIMRAEVKQYASGLFRLAPKTKTILEDVSATFLMKAEEEKIMNRT